MSNKIQTFIHEMFGDVRIVIKDEELWFCASDVSKALGDRDAFATVRGLEDEDKDTHVVCTLGGNQEMLFISEYGLYEIVISKKPKSAEKKEHVNKFKRWLSREVIPSIRKTGGYIETNREEEFVNKAFDVEDEIKDRLIEQLKAKNQELEDKNKELESMADYWSKFCDLEETFTFMETCEIITTRSKEEKVDINICVNKLTALLRDKGVLSKRKVSKCYYNLPRTKYRDMFNVVPVDFSMCVVGTQTRVKGNGIGFIYELVKSSKDEDLVI